jgi:hypothetical protein
VHPPVCITIHDVHLTGATPAEVAAATALVGALATAAGLDRNRALRVVSDALSLAAAERADRVTRAA